MKKEVFQSKKIKSYKKYNFTVSLIKFNAYINLNSIYKS